MFKFYQHNSRGNKIGTVIFFTERKEKIMKLSELKKRGTWSNYTCWWRRTTSKAFFGHGTY